MGFFESHLDPAPETYKSLAYGWVDNGVCTCETMERTPIPGMKSATCVMHEEELLVDDDKNSIFDDTYWWVIAGCVFFFCCIIPLFFFYCKAKQDNEYTEHILLDDKPPAEGQEGRSPKGGHLRAIE